MLIPLIRVLKWHGHADLARKVAEEHIPLDIAHKEFARMRRPLTLLLSICDINSCEEYYQTHDVESDVSFALELEYPDMVRHQEQ